MAATLATSAARLYYGTSSDFACIDVQNNGSSTLHLLIVVVTIFAILLV